MIAPEIRNGRQPSPNQHTNAAVTKTVAVSSAATRSSSSTAMYLGTSASTACSGGDGSLAEVASSLAPARDTRSSAVSALAHNPANSASTTPATTSQPTTRYPGSCGPPSSAAAVRIGGPLTGGRIVSFRHRRPARSARR